MTTAGLVTVEADRVSHLASHDISTLIDVTEVNDEYPAFSGDEITDEIFEANTDAVVATSTVANGDNGITRDAPRRSPKAVFQVNVTLDSSMDVEKLQKQLELLKRFGAI